MDSTAHGNDIGATSSLRLPRGPLTGTRYAPLRRAASDRARLATRGVHTATQALTRLEREHVALLLAICELETPPRTQDDLTGAPEVRAALRTLLREDLGRTQHALARAASGHYGTCEDCHRPISRRHLEIKPASTRCSICEAQARRAARN